MRPVIRRRRRATVGPDAGFTLIELVVTVSILGIISAALISVVYQYVKVVTSNQTRLSESTDQQFVSAYWQQDVSSLGRRTFAVTPTPMPYQQSVWVGAAGPTNCGGSLGGSIVVAFAWNGFTVAAPDPDNAWASTAEEVAYVTVTSGGKQLLKRARCSDGAEISAPRTVAHNLAAAPVVECDPSCNPAGDVPTRVRMTIQVRDTSEGSVTGYTTVLTADRRQG